MHKGSYFSKPKQENICKEKRLTKRQRWHSLSLDDKVNMIYDVVVGKEKLEVVAQRYCRTMGHVSNLVKRLKKKRSILRDLICKRDQRLMQEAAVQQVIKGLLEEQRFISSLKLVVDEVQEQKDLKVTPAFVSQQMHALGLSYKKVK